MKQQVSHLLKPHGHFLLPFPSSLRWRKGVMPMCCPLIPRSTSASPRPAWLPSSTEARRRSAVCSDFLRLCLCLLLSVDVCVSTAVRWLANACLFLCVFWESGWKVLSCVWITLSFAKGIFRTCFDNTGLTVCSQWSLLFPSYSYSLFQVFSNERENQDAMLLWSS